MLFVSLLWFPLNIITLVYGHIRYIYNGKEFYIGLNNYNQIVKTYWGEKKQ